MHKLASFNHQIKSASEIILPAVSDAAFYGKSIFTTIAVYQAKPFQWEKHWQRLGVNAAAIGINLDGFLETATAESLFNLISANNFQNGRARITFFGETANGIWSAGVSEKTNLLITTADFKPVSENFQITVSPFFINSKSPLAKIKSGNYLENILALEDAKKRGFDEALRLNEKGEAVSAAMANIFWIRGEKIFTTLLESGALKGTTRSFVIENFSVTEKNIGLEELKSASEIFLTSAGIGIRTVKKIDDRAFEKFPVSNQIRNFYDALIKNLA